jgi:hypothetical protein
VGGHRALDAGRGGEAGRRGTARSASSWRGWRSAVSRDRGARAEPRRELFVRGSADAGILRIVQ